MEREGEGIGFLARGTRGAPDADALPPAGGDFVREPAEHYSFHYVKRVPVAEPARFVGRHRVDNPVAQSERRIANRLAVEVGKGGTPCLGKKPREPVFHKIGLLITEGYAAALFNELAELSEFRVGKLIHVIVQETRRARRARRVASLSLPLNLELSHDLLQPCGQFRKVLAALPDVLHATGRFGGCPVHALYVA